MNSQRFGSQRLIAQAVAQSANSIDAQLTQDALRVGESREGNSRVLIVEPLAVFYDVVAEDALVAVWGVRRQR